MVKVWTANQVLLQVVNQREESFLRLVLSLLICIHFNGLTTRAMNEILHVPVDLRSHLLLLDLAIYPLLFQVSLLLFLHFHEFFLLDLKL